MAVLTISGLDDAALAERAIELGAYGYVVTPFSTDDVLTGVFEALRQRRAELDARGEIRAAQEQAIQRLCVATRARQPGAVPHINQVSGYCWHLARQLGLGRHDCEPCAWPARCTTSARSWYRRAYCASPRR